MKMKNTISTSFNNTGAFLKYFAKISHYY